MAITLCILAFCLSYLGGRRSLSIGLLIVLITGYAYGILRANILSTFSHFIFDAAVIGLYASQPWSSSSEEKSSLSPLRIWLAVLIGWPLLVCFLPFQTPLVSIVGLRGNAFLVPALLLGTRLRAKDLAVLAYGLAALNTVALGFATAEYFLGVERFVPLSEVTRGIYGSQDVAGYTFFRIPSTFVTSAAYAGTMVVTLPFLYGVWTRPSTIGWRSRLLLVGMGSALLGVLMGASRSHFIVASVLILVAIFSNRVSPARRVVLLVATAALVATALSNERFQRFQTLSDTEMVADRVAGSVNRTFFEILTEYPIGNGLGGGGTSIPYFLQNHVRRPIAMENEYARILLEQGLPGLLLWIGFIGWALSRRTTFANDSWHSGRRLAWFSCACYFGIGLIGIGLLTAIPQSLIFMLIIGWMTAPQSPELPVSAIGAAGWQAQRVSASTAPVTA